MTQNILNFFVFTFEGYHLDLTLIPEDCLKCLLKKNDKFLSRKSHLINDSIEFGPLNSHLF